ncbi:MAG: cell division protein FtsZ, partial [Sphingomicrobium sp.]
LDFADVRSVMGEMGKAMMGTGEASGENRAIEAAEKAISNPLLDGVSLKGAKGVIISITGGDDMKLMEVDEAASHIKELVDPDANIIWGSAFNNGLEGKIRVSVVATGIESETGTMAQPAKVFSFPGRTAPASLNVAPTPTVTQTFTPTATDTTATATDDDMLELTSDDEAGELVLDGDDVLTTPVGSVPVGPPVDDEPTIDDTAPTATEDKPKLAPGGGTLFERMSNIARGAAQAEGSDGEAAPSFRREPLDIPRFLNRQNNQ